MSNLPEIDPVKIEQKLLSKFAEQLSQTLRLEVLAEALRDERDFARNERDLLKIQLDELRAEQDSAESTPDGE